MKSTGLHICLWGMIVLVLGVLSAVAAADEGDRSGDGLSPTIIDDNTYINANKILMFVDNHGGFAQDLPGVFGYDYGTFYPYVSTKDIIDGIMCLSPLRAAGLWVGGKISGEIRVTVAEYATEYVPGPMTEGTYTPDDPSFHVYELYRDSLEDNPNSDYLNWPMSQGAPVDGEGEPLMRGDQMIWSVFNDADPSAHTVFIGKCAPLGIEVQQTVWASDDQGTDTLPGPTGVEVTQTGDSRVEVKVDIVDWQQMTGHEYRVIVDTLPTNSLEWRLEDVTLGATVLSHQTNFTGDDTSPVVDGVRIRVLNPPQGGLAGWRWTGSTRPLTGVDWGGSGFFGGVGVLDEFFSSDLSREDLRSVEIRWTGRGNGQNAYRYIRSSDFSYGGFWQQDFEVWDVTPGFPERQINFAFVEQVFPWLGAGPHTPMDSLWDPGVQLRDIEDLSSHDPYGGREYFLIMTSDYSETPLADYTIDGWFTGAGGSKRDILYGGWLTHRLYDGKPDSGDVFLLIPDDKVAVPDTFFFTAMPPEFVTTGPEGVSIYISYKLYNKGANTIQDCYVSLWAGPELGASLVGCDSLTDMFYCYNGYNIDFRYGIRSPAVGFRVLYGPLVSSAGDTAYFDGLKVPDSRNLGLTSFVKQIRDLSYPLYFAQAYAQMQGLQTSGEPYVYAGDTTTFWSSGDPVSGSGDLDTWPGDRNMMGSCGPFTFNPGDSQYVLIKMSVGQGSDRLQSLTRLKEILNLPFDIPTDVDDNEHTGLPVRYELGQNYPNPFNPSTKINYWLPQRSHVEIDIYNILGQQVTTLVNEDRPAGAHTAVWDGTDGSGSRVSTGIYFYRIKAGSFVESRKMLLLK